MASLTMMASLSAVAPASGRVSSAAPRRGGLAVARAAAGGAAECQRDEVAAVAQGAEGRRAVMFAAAAVALSAIGGAGAGAAFAEPDVKKGTPEAKKKYASICVTMPTAKVCHN
ncbi:photosystem II 5 kDa protein, chloroplastic-like [Oryza brachyantha]|uniref:photosystem II 5 kDa protein, chloroplastic-like n=1 Tax=Oryza brachyantha TaxID=4533 RepID=UPI001ADC1BFA|nr:photosystem II 5 kDa protein, chloroplastic-like [Oryza brachyantha]